MLAITTLRTKRAEIEDAPEGLGRQVERRRTDLMHVDATVSGANFWATVVARNFAA